MVIDNKMIDYKIGGHKRDKGSWTIRLNDELIERFKDVEVISISETVNNDIEHQQAFENGSQKVSVHIKQYGSYYND